MELGYRSGAGRGKPATHESPVLHPAGEDLPVHLAGIDLSIGTPDLHPAGDYPSVGTPVPHTGSVTAILSKPATRGLARGIASWT